MTTRVTAADIHAHLDESWCQCGQLPEGIECHWHKLFDAGLALQELESSLTARDEQIASLKIRLAMAICDADCAYDDGFRDARGEGESA